MFIFDDLAKVDAQSIGVILREVDFNTLAIAMKECSPELNDIIFKNITKRAAESLAENLKYSTSVKKKEVEEARAKVMEVVFELERKGDVTLYPEEETSVAA
jgi:flagellar motor switch protein FliG